MQLKLERDQQKNDNFLLRKAFVIRKFMFRVLIGAGTYLMPANTLNAMQSLRFRFAWCTPNAPKTVFFLLRSRCMSSKLIDRSNWLSVHKSQLLHVPTCHALMDCYRNRFNRQIIE